ncbi:alpha/beta hydrolase [Streptomyces sp. NPDC127178]|uniref:alpha/beta hydrolase n=1 Tax=unclassified Streptomyces TaxID=2593676 RepID=UPI00362F97F2
MRTPRRLRAAAVAAVVPLTLLAACEPGAEAKAGAASAGALDRFYDQKPAFEACEPPPTPGAAEPQKPWPGAKFECARLKVPLNYEEPDGKTASIAVFRVAARGGKPTGSLLLNPGGPGFPGTSFAPQAAAAWASSPITESFDLVGFDPRGVGKSTPALDCYTDAERENDAMIASFDSGADDWNEQETKKLYEQCAERSGGADTLAHVGTRDVARDMDVLREVLGDDKLTFAGTSYGTRLGAVYAEMFPAKVRALVLDAAFDPLKGSRQRRLEQASGLQRSFEQMAAFCSTQADCPLGTDPKRATEVFQKLAQPLVDKPIPAGKGRELTFVEAVSGVTTGLYTKSTWPMIIKGIAGLRDGRGDTLIALRDIIHERAADGTYSNALEATIGINCLDEERNNPAAETALKRDVIKAAPYADTGRPITEARDGCEHWPVQPTLGYPYATGIKGLPDTLTVSTTGDPVTPYEGGVSLARTLGGSLLTVEGNQHGAALARNSCINDALSDYLIRLKTPGDQARCKL